MSFMSVKQLSEAYPAFSQSSLRWIIFNAHSNGANSFIRRIGNKIVLEADSFVKWVDSQREA